MSIADKYMEIVKNIDCESIKQQAKFKAGQQVRIKSTLTTNVHAVLDLLGKVGTIEKAYVKGMLDPEIMYDIRVGNRVEPFYEWELDQRYGRR
jgi:hypothetical protein